MLHSALTYWPIGFHGLAGFDLIWCYVNIWLLCLCAIITTIYVSFLKGLQSCGADEGQMAKQKTAPESFSPHSEVTGTQKVESQPCVFTGCSSVSSLSEAFLFVFRVNLLKPSNQSNSRKCVSAKSGSESFAKTKTESKTLICCDLLLLCAKNMSCHSQHLFQCACTAGIVNMWTEDCTHSLYFWASACASDSDLGCTCWLVSAGIKSLQMIQLKNNEDSLIYQKVCVCVCMQEGVSLTEKQPYCVQVFIIWIVCTSTCQSSAYEKVLFPGKKKLHFSATPAVMLRKSCTCWELSSFFH